MNRDRNERIRETHRSDQQIDDEYMVARIPTVWERLSQLWNPPARAAFSELEMDTAKDGVESALSNVVANIVASK